MNSSDKIKRLFKNAELSVDPNTDEKMFDDVLQARQTVTKKVSAMPEIWRITMKNPITKLAIAAVFVIACFTGLTMFDRTSGVVLANVLTRIEQISAYMYQMNMSTTGSLVRGDKSIDINQETQSTIIFSQEYGVKMITENLDPNSEGTISQEKFLLLKEKNLITLLHEQKSYTRMEFDDAYFERMKKESYDPHKMVELILECEYKSLGISTIDGIKVAGFQTNDPKYQGGVLGHVDIILWVDVKTQLPVQIEMNFQMEGQVNMSMNCVIHNFQWDVAVDAAEFQPIIPDDYTSALGDSIKVPAFNEETAIQGLKLHADLIGNYPEELNPVTLPSQIFKIMKSGTPAAKRLQEEIKEKKTQKLTESMMSIQGAGMFYMQLVQENKAPAYYGDIITPEDADQVLMRWKVSDTEYRVIYGNLNAETVEAEVLAELESALE